MSSKKIGFDIDGTLHFERSGDQFEIVFNGQRLDVDGPSVLALWLFLGDLRGLGDTKTASDLVQVAPFEVWLKVKTEYIGKTIFSLGEQHSMIGRLRQFRPELTTLAKVLTWDMIRYLKR